MSLPPSPKGAARAPRGRGAGVDPRPGERPSRGSGSPTGGRPGRPGGPAGAPLQLLTPPSGRRHFGQRGQRHFHPGGPSTSVRAPRDSPSRRPPARRPPRAAFARPRPWARTGAERSQVGAILGEGRRRRGRGLGAPAAMSTAGSRAWRLGFTARAAAAGFLRLRSAEGGGAWAAAAAGRAARAARLG